MKLSSNFGLRKSALNEHGVEVVFLNQDIQHQTVEGNLSIQMQGAFAEYERAKILERTRRGRRFAARQGKVSVLGDAPYGWPVQNLPVFVRDSVTRSWIRPPCRCPRSLYAVGVARFSLGSRSAPWGRRRDTRRYPEGVTQIVCGQGVRVVEPLRGTDVVRRRGPRVRCATLG